jgi:reverse gyrase
VLFTIVTFPFDHLIRKKLSELEGKSFRILSVDQIDVNFSATSNVKKLELVLLDGTEINTKNVILNLSLNPYRLFISHRILSDVQVDDFFL